MSEVFRRFRAIGESSIGEDGKVRLVVSTDEPVLMGKWREVLRHDVGCVDISAARSLLINHDPNQLAGGVSELSSDGHAITCEADIDADAKMQSGVNVRKAVANRTLNGVSASYVYDRADAVFDAESRTVTVNKWRLLEVTLTPIPADARAHVRSLPFDFEGQPTVAVSTNITSNHPTAPAAITSEKRMTVPDNKPQENTPAAPIHDETARAREVAELRERAERLEREVSIRSLAAEHNIDLKDFDFGKVKTEAEGLRMLMKRKAEANKTPEPASAAVEMRIDQADKARDAFLGAQAFRSGMRSGEFAELQKSNPLVGPSFKHSVRKYARLMGLDPSDWSDRDTAFFALGKPEMMDQRFARSANVTSSTFPSFVFLNAMTKIVAKGFEAGSAGAKYKIISRPNTVPDFRSFYVGSLAAGNLTQTAEDTAFPELTKTEVAYNDTVKMWGGTLSLTVQAIANDDTGMFDRMLGQAGVLADKTIDKRTFQKLLMGTSSSEATSTWTSNTTSGGSLVYTTADLASAARGKLGLVRAAFMNKLGLDGNPLGNPPVLLVVPVTREVEAQGIVGGSGPALQAGVQQPSMSMQVVASPWLELSSLTGYSTTSYYIGADPDAVTGLLVSKVAGYESIQVQPYDAGAVAAMNFKLWLPFEVSLFKGANSAGTTIVPAFHQGTT